MSFTRSAALTTAVACLGLFAAGCGDSASKDPNAQTVKVGISDAGCSPEVLTIPEGPKNFEVAATGSGKVTEYEILQGDKVLAERENLTPGSTGEFSLDLAAGQYTSYCPNGSKTEKGKIVVNSSAK